MIACYDIRLCFVVFLQELEYYLLEEQLQKTLSDLEKREKALAHAETEVSPNPLSDPHRARASCRCVSDTLVCFRRSGCSESFAPSTSSACASCRTEAGVCARTALTRWSWRGRRSGSWRIYWLSSDSR